MSELGKDHSLWSGAIDKEGDGNINANGIPSYQMC